MSFKSPEELASAVCHEDQMIIWASEILDYFSEYLREMRSYDDIIDLNLAAQGAVRHIVKGAFSHPEAQTTDSLRMPEHIDSTSDTRTANNTVRHQYRVLTEKEKAQVLKIKDLGEAFIDACREVGTSRELSLAITRAEEATFWAVKHVTR